MSRRRCFLAAAPTRALALSIPCLPRRCDLLWQLEQMQRMKREYDELRRNHEKLQHENEEVRKIVGDMYVSVDEDRAIRDNYLALYKDIMDSLDAPTSRTGGLMPKIYDTMVRMNDEDIRKVGNRILQPSYLSCYSRPWPTLRTGVHHADGDHPER